MGISCSLCPPLSFSYSLYASLSFSLSCSSLFLFFHPTLPYIPLNRRNNHPTATANKTFLMGNSCSRPSPLLLLLSLYASLSFLSLMFFFSFLHPPPYIGFISTLCLFIFSLSLVLFNSFFNLNLRSYGQLFVLVFCKI